MTESEQRVNDLTEKLCFIGSMVSGQHNDDFYLFAEAAYDEIMAAGMEQTPRPSSSLHPDMRTEPVHALLDMCTMGDLVERNICVKHLLGHNCKNYGCRHRHLPCPGCGLPTPHNLTACCRRAGVETVAANLAVFFDKDCDDSVFNAEWTKVPKKTPKKKK